MLAAPAGLGGWLQSLEVVDDVVAVRDLDEAAGLATRSASPEVAVNLHGRGPVSHQLVKRLGADQLVGFACPEVDFDDGPLWDEEEHEVDRWIRVSQWVGGGAEPDDLRLPSPGARGEHVVVHPGAASGSRRWPVRRWGEVAATLVAEGHRVVVTGTHGEADLCAQVAASAPGIEDHCGRHDLAELGHLVGSASLLLSGDTGVAHVATAFGAPSVTLFGPVAPALWGPRIDPHLHRALWNGAGPQLRPGDAHGTEPDVRLLAIEVPEVLDAAHEALEVRASP